MDWESVCTIHSHLQDFSSQILSSSSLQSMFDLHQFVVHFHQSVCASRWCPPWSRYRRHEPCEFRCHPLCFFFFLSIGPIRLSIGMIHMNYKSSCFLWITNLYGTNRSCRWKKPTSCAVALQHSLQGQPQTQCKQIAAIIDHRTNHNTEGEAQKKKSATEWYKRKKERTTKKK